MKYVIEHGIIHDTETGKHVDTVEACALLNTLRMEIRAALWQIACHMQSQEHFSYEAVNEAFNLAKAYGA